MLQKFDENIIRVHDITSETGDHGLRRCILTVFCLENDSIYADGFELFVLENCVCLLPV
ncbi:MAG: hypothetical protein LBP59_05380 [Planctomycetaceae bacterium]|nr:hypothetical protein [Planctomycetaceae bacterium]